MKWTIPARLAILFFVTSASLTAIAAPDEVLLGKKSSYRIGNAVNLFTDESVRVGSFSNLDRIRPHNFLRKAASTLALSKAGNEPNIEYRFEGQTYTLQDFLARQRITGLMLIKDQEILVERYQYDRKSSQRFLSNSMSKSIVSLAVAIALHEGRIRSLDDAASKYEEGLKGSPYGETSIRNLLRMSSGVKFEETSYARKDDLARFTSSREARGSIEALKEFRTRVAPEGQRFRYASSETVVLAVVLRAVTHSSLSDYLTTRLWQPMGAEADASWSRGRDGLESAAGGFNATLSDYGRLGMLLAHDGAIGNRQVVSKEYLLEATDWHRQPGTFAPGIVNPYFGYGYQFWTFPGEKRRFALQGAFGQSIFVDPELRITMVITAAAKNGDAFLESLGSERDALWRGIINKYGSW